MPYQRDPKYYPDGSAVILVGNVLFKFQLSLILRPGNTSNHTISGDPTLRDRLPNSCDSNPVKLKGHTPGQFRNFLRVVLGLSSDLDYLALLTGAQDAKNHNRDLLMRYLDIASLAQRFGMAGLETWARGQLQLVLRSSHKFTHSEWDRNTLNRLHSYAHSSGGSAVRVPVKTFIQYFISVSADKIRQLPAPSNFNTCIELYKDDTLKKRDPALFGCVFAATVSQPHREWASTLTQQDKALLYVAQVQLTSIANQLQSLHWLLAPASELSFFTEMCLACRSALPRLWADTFGKCGCLNSSVLLQDISSLTHLPQNLHSFSQTWKNVDCMGIPDPGARSRQQPSLTTYHDLLLRSLRFANSLNGILEPEASERPRESQKCRNHYLPRIGALIDEVYNELAAQHAKLAPEP